MLNVFVQTEVVEDTEGGDSKSGENKGRGTAPDEEHARCQIH